MTKTYFTRIINPIINSDDILYVISYLRQKNVLHYSIYCVSCCKTMKQVKRVGSPDGYAFRCYTIGCNKYQHHQSIRFGSILINFTISLKKFIHVVYLYSMETTQEFIEETVGLSNSTLYKLIKVLRNRIGDYFVRNPIILGGPEVIVQIDESKFNFNVKAHRGHAPSEPIWVFGIVDTSFRPARGYMRMVENRDRNTLVAIIREHVRPNTIIYSDEWRAYANIGELEFIHGTVCHKYNFVNPITGVHTQHVESYWNRQKYRIKKSKGLIKVAMKNVLDEYMFFDLWNENIYEALMSKIIKL